MKELFISSSFNFINNHKNLSEYEKIKIKYGLEVMYHFITKTIVLLLVSYVLNFFVQTLLIFIFFGTLRTFCHGIHAKTNLQCWLLTITTYIVCGVCCKLVNFTFLIKIIICVFTFLHILIFAPSDTIYRPIRNVKHRVKLKLFSLLISLLYIYYIINHFNIYSKCMIVSLILISFSINPLTYKIFNLTRNNYKTPKQTIRKGWY
jgi:accessory gene regulator B